jgi:hypothetical protein
MKSKLPKIKRGKITQDFLDFLWSTAIKCRADFKDEISGDTECDFNAHHIIGKCNKVLRWIVLENGICISTGRHKFSAHGSQSRQEDFRRQVMQLRGNDIYDKLYEFKSKVEKVNLLDVQDFLLRRIAEHNEKLVSWYQGKEYKTKQTLKNYEKLFKMLQEGINV